MERQPQVRSLFRGEGYGVKVKIEKIAGEKDRPFDKKVFSHILRVFPVPLYGLRKERALKKALRIAEELER